MRIDTTKFSDKKELFKYLHANKSQIIDLKKSTLKFTDCFGATTAERSEVKALNTAHVDDPTTGAVKRTIIANTYNWRDSHKDVHYDNVFAKSISERQQKIFHLADHSFKITSKIGVPSQIYEKAIQWINLGINKFGYTQALFMDSEIKEDFNPRMFKAYLRGEVDQHSVGMQYMKMALAINDPDYKEEFAEWNKMIDKIGNRAEVEEDGFFWGIKEAALKEISAVLEGSNELTPTLNNIDPAAASQKQKPEDDSTSNQNAKTDFIYL